jgi:Membrane domain of glycerophosphoryl diester phosphodiesterase
MTDTVIAAEPPRLRVGAVISRSFTLLFGDFLKFFILALIAWLPVLAALLIFGFRYAAGGFSGVPPTGGLIAIGVLVALLSGASFVLSQAVILYGAFERMRGHSFAVGRSLQQGLARFFPIVGAYILLMLAIGLGMVLLLVPGIILAMMFFVALPACIVESKGPAESLSRSAELTKGNRWRLFGLALLLYLINVVGRAIVQFGLLALAGPLLSNIAVFLWSAAFGAVNAIMIAVVYYDLRVAREGVDIERIAAVFD